MVVLDGHHSSRATYPPDEPAVVLALVLALLALVPVPVRGDRLPLDVGYYLNLVIPRKEEPPKKITVHVRLLHGRTWK